MKEKTVRVLLLKETENTMTSIRWNTCVQNIEDGPTLCPCYKKKSMHRSSDTGRVTENVTLYNIMNNLFRNECTLSFQIGTQSHRS